MMVITPKHVGDVLMSILMGILKLFLRQFNCASVGKQKNFDNTETVQFYKTNSLHMQIHIHYTNTCFSG
jgi:hypothetical protein